MFKRIKLTIITLGLASGMTAGALFYLHNVDTCRQVVLNDMVKHQQFGAELNQFVQTQDFLTELKKGGK